MTTRTPSPTAPLTLGALVRYDRARRRLWLAGQRVHHGAIGALVAAASLSLLALAAAAPVTCATLTLASALLIAHDWGDRHIWFELGWGSQP